MEIQVDPIKCEAHGLCAELLPERITLDEWGYPLIDPTPVPPALEDLARRAVSACPTLALRLRISQRSELPPQPGRRVPAGQRPGRTAPEDAAYRVYGRRRGRG